ncbi:hypothetical protein GUITHDRAFT_99792 [Guillardia theta CCMP2712]|uniref:EGF-like domain-containing protein n=2 Tax=Guillardia theta TaxID=55529 RepID=L1K1K7_GUITC|nr:hypothetical protein GUITHDRAFT_99792 [Guillardia theta CCMP2712]EKX54315.1 hypothetical protein GUITHDRAFT_99792 [Guillardia theta CCMP2712]|eukprot:XP_005841295.1 hypothetical protein GUITHDRAFT_99792 [Guillardia theta CCMP2712]
MGRLMRSDRLVLALLGLALCFGAEYDRDDNGSRVEKSRQDEADQEPECMFMLLSPELDVVYEGRIPSFEIQVSPACPCPSNGEHEIAIWISRESNKRHLNVVTNMSCTFLQEDFGLIDLIDIKDGHWEGGVTFNTLWGMHQPVRFDFVSPFNPQIDVLLPTPGYVYGAGVDPVIVLHIHDITDPHEPLLGILVRITVNGVEGAITRNPGRDKYIHLRESAEGEYFPDGRYDIQLQVLDLLYRPRGEPVSLDVVIDRSKPPASKSDRVLHDCPAPADISRCPNCSSHGTCRGDIVCECDADWIGDTCQHHMLTHTHFLPDLDKEDTATRCHRRSRWVNSTRRIAAAIQQQQNPPSCSDEHVQYLTDMNRHPLAVGHGLRWEALMLGESLKNKSIYLPGPTWSLFSYHKCAGLGLWCHLEHPTTCKAANMSSVREIASQVLVTHVTRRWDFAEGFHDVGMFNWFSTLMGLTVRPRSLLHSELNHMKNVIGFKHPIIGVHIRYGDGCLPNQLHRPPCEPVETYVEEIMRMVMKYEVSTVFLATDSAQALEQLKSNFDFETLHAPVDRSLFDSRWWIDHRAAFGVVDPMQVGESALMDLLLLSECDYFIGTFSSHFSLAAFELSTFKKGYVPPYVSYICILSSA